MKNIIVYLHCTRNDNSVLNVSPSVLTAEQTYLPALNFVTFCNTRLWLERMILADIL